jgi:hypothetical protein
VDDRDLLEAKYTSPSGKEFILFWEKVSKKTELKTGIFTFPDKDGAHVQHQGGGPVSFPMTCIFNGDNHKKTADDFETALLERDMAELQHPVYGTRKVIPTGDIQRDDNYITTLNEAHVTVTFTETITDEEPAKLEAVTADEIESDFDEFSDSAAADFAENLAIETIDEGLEIQAILSGEADILNDNLLGIVSSDSIGSSYDIPAIDSVTRKSKFSDFTTSTRELKNNIKTLLNKTENLTQKSINIARLSLNLMKLPSRMIVNITEKIKGYSHLISQIANQFKNDPYGVNRIKNSFASTRLVLSGAIASVSSGAALSIANNAIRHGALTPAGSGSIGSASASGILTREAAVAVAVQLKSMLRDINDFEDTKIEKNNFIDSSASAYLLMIRLINKSIKLILTSCFALPMKKTIKLDRDRNFIELCAELYGTIDDVYLDRLIIENNLNVDELEIIPMGREVAYYVESA